MDSRTIVTEAMQIASSLCIYTNTIFSIEEIENGAGTPG